MSPELHSSSSRPVAPERVRFAGFEADLRSRELYRDGERVPLQDRPFEVLAALLERPGEVVLRQELQDRLWPGQIVEFDNNLNTALTKLRRALDDTTDEPTVIETLPKRGYRLIVPVEPVPMANAEAASGEVTPREATPEPPRRGGRRAGLVTAALLATTAAAIVLSVVRGSRPENEPATDAPGARGAPRRTALLVVLPFKVLGGSELDRSAMEGSEISWSPSHRVSGGAASGEPGHGEQGPAEARPGYPAPRSPVLGETAPGREAGTQEAGTQTGGARASGVSTADERLADVLTEELITRLAELLPVEIGVIARTSAMRFRSGVDIAEVRQALGVDYVLEGSVGRDGDGLRIHTRFIHAGDQAHLWAESHTAPLERMPRVERSIAERVATAVSAQLRIRGSLAATAPSEEPLPPEVWEAYLQGRYLLTSSLTPSDEAIAGAVERLSGAVEAAPRFALAWAALADAIVRQPGAAPELTARARQAAHRALELDPGLALPHHRLASIALYQDWDWEAARREYERALALAPNLALLHHSRAAWYSTQGRHEEALRSIEIALELDPLSVVLHADAGWYLFTARRYEEAVARCREAIELVSGHRGANSYLFHSLLALGRTDEAGEVARTLLEIEEAPLEVRERTTASAEAAIDELRRYRLAVLEADHAAGLASPGRLALAHLDLGHTEEALAHLEEGLEGRWGWIYPFLAVYPLLDPLRGDPRFEAMLEAVGVPPAGRA